MPNDYIDDFFECVYNAEIQQKQHLDSADSFLVGILAGLIGFGAYLVQLLAKADSGGAACCLWVIAVPYLASLIGALSFVIWSIIPRFKEYISSPRQWADYVQGYDAYYAYFHQEPTRSDRVAVELRDLRRQQYIQAGENNRQLIYTKHKAQTRAKWCFAIAAIFMLLSAGPIYCIQRAEVGKKKYEQTAKPTNAVAADSAATIPVSPIAPDTSRSGQSSPAPDSTNSGPDSGGNKGAE